jgi:hypothetical protein
MSKVPNRRHCHLSLEDQRNAFVEDSLRTLTLQISIDILSIFFNKQSFTLMLHFIYFIYLHLIHLCCKLSVLLISPVIPSRTLFQSN